MDEEDSSGRSASPSEASEVDSTLGNVYDTSGDDSDEEQVTGLDSSGESDCAVELSDADGDAADGENTGNGSDGDDPPADAPICSSCTARLDLSRLVTADEDLECDSYCHRTMPASELRLVCPRGCDFDVCMACAGLGRGGRARSQLAPASPLRPTPPSPQSPAECGEQSAPLTQLAQPDTAAAAGRPAVVPTVPLPAAPPPAPGLVAALLGRMAGRAFTQTTRGERAQASFVQWQAERAAARRATSAGNTAASAGGTATSAGDTMMVVAWEAEPREASELRRAAPTPSTDYTLQQPPEIAFVPEEAGRALRQQVAGILAGDDERRQLWIGLAHEVLLQSEGLQPSAPTTHGEHAIPEAASYPSARSAFSPPRRLGVELDHSSVLPPNSVTRSARCMCCDEDVGDGEVGRCSALGLLATLEEDLQEQDRIINQVIEFDFEVEALHRAARKHMYRTYVAARFGYLGRGVRVRLPDCVVAAIRSRYRIPTCECSLDAIVSCNCGHSGFKET